MKPTDKTPKHSLGKPQDYPRLLTEIKERIRSAQYEALKAVNPNVRAILTTGYGLDGHAQDTLDAGMVGYLQKPYHSEDLVNAVEDALARELPEDAGARPAD